MHGPVPSARPAPHAISPRRRLVYNLLAWLCFGLGFVGMVVPLMPTTVFWICATWLWLRSSPKRVRFLVEHPHFGESIRGFLERGEICRTGKQAAIGAMAGSYLIWFLMIGPGWVTATLVASILALVATWIATRPDSRHPTPTQVAVKLDLGGWVKPEPAVKPAANPPAYEAVGKRGTH